MNPCSRSEAGPQGHAAQTRMARLTRAPTNTLGGGLGAHRTFALALWYTVARAGGNVRLGRALRGAPGRFHAKRFGRLSGGPRRRGRIWRGAGLPHGLERQLVPLSPHFLDHGRRAVESLVVPDDRQSLVGHSGGLDPVWAGDDLRDPEKILARDRDLAPLRLQLGIAVLVQCVADGEVVDRVAEPGNTDPGRLADHGGPLMGYGGVRNAVFGGLVALQGEADD